MGVYGYGREVYGRAGVRWAVVWVDRIGPGRGGGLHLRSALMQL